MKTPEQCIVTITEYLSLGGLFNPEAMEHDKVRDLLMDCRTCLSQLNAEPIKIKLPFVNEEAHQLCRMILASLRERLSITLSGASDDQLKAGILNGIKHFSNFSVTYEHPMNTINPDHPHGPADPRWITDEGRCLLCAYSFHTREIERLKKQCESLQSRGDKAIDQVRQLDGLNHKIAKERDALLVVERAAKCVKELDGYVELRDALIAVSEIKERNLKPIDPVHVCTHSIPFDQHCPDCSVTGGEKDQKVRQG